MIYLNYKKEKFWIDIDGKTYSALSDAENAPHAVITDSSTFKKNDDESYRYYSKTKNGYFLENEIVNKNSRSLLECLGLAEGKIVGVYFSNRVLMFALVNNTIKSRFSPENIFSPDDIVYPFLDWGLPENAPVEIYGVHKSLDELLIKIKSTQPLKDREAKRQKLNLIQKTLGIVLIVLTLASYAGTNWFFSYQTKQKSRLQNLTTGLQSELSDELKKRLPQVLECINLPLDEVLYQIKFLEPFQFTSINLDAQKNTLTVKTNIHDPKVAYQIKQEAQKHNIQCEVKLSQGGGDVELIFSTNIKKNQKNSYFADTEFCSRIDRYNQFYTAPVK